MRRLLSVGGIGGLLTGLALMLALPITSSGQQDVLGQVVDGVNRTVDRVAPGLRQKLAPAPSQPRGEEEGPPPYQPPAHGTNPHGQGSVLTLDFLPSEARPYPAHPEQVEEQDGLDGIGDTAVEEVILGRARGEQNPDGTYHGTASVAFLAFLGTFFGVETNEGDPPEQVDLADLDLLEDFCNETGICIFDLLSASSSTTDHGSTNETTVSEVGLFTDFFGFAGKGSPPLAFAEFGNAEGEINEDADCQVATGRSSLTDAGVFVPFDFAGYRGGPGPFLEVDVISTETRSEDCNSRPSSQQNESTVVDLSLAGDQALYAGDEEDGCQTGEPDFVALAIFPVALRCNADDTNGNGEPVDQAVDPYGVREGLTAQVYNFLDGDEDAITTQGDEPLPPILLQGTFGLSDSKATRPPLPPEAPPTTPPTQPPPVTPPVDDDDGGDEEEDEGGEEDEDDGGDTSPGGEGGGPADTTVTTAQTGLPFTGVELVWFLFGGTVCLLLGLRLRKLTAPRLESGGSSRT